MKQVCIVCGEEKRPNQLLKHKNAFLKDGYSICKDCANNLADFKDKESVIQVCQLTNLPYIERLVVDLVKSNDNVSFGLYMKRLAPFKRFETFRDSEFSEDGLNESMSKEFKVSNTIIQRWGDGYSQEEYAYFEAALKGLMAIKAATTSLELERYIQNVKLKDVLNKALHDGDFKAITQLRKSYNDDLKELGFDSVLNAKDDSGESLGQRIQKWETTKPVPDREEFEDGSGIMKYILNWFIIPMRRNLGMAAEKEVESLYDDTDDKQ